MEDGRRQRQHLTLLEKNELRKRHESRPELTYSDLQLWVSSSMGKSIGLSTVGKIVKTPLVQSATDSQMKRRQHEAIETPLLAFVRTLEDSQSLSDHAIQRQAAVLAGKTISMSWVQRFKIRHGVEVDARQTAAGFRPRHEEIYGLQYVRDTEDAVCRFCEAFGREIGRRKGVMRFTTFRADLYRQHLTTAHPSKWAVYQKLEEDNREEFFSLGQETPWEEQESEDHDYDRDNYDVEEESEAAEEEEREAVEESGDQVNSNAHEVEQQVVTIATESTEGPERQQVDRERLEEIEAARKPATPELTREPAQKEVGSADRSPNRRFILQSTPRSQLLGMMADIVASQKASIESLQTAILNLQQDDLELRRQELAIREQELACLRAEREEMEKERRARETERQAEREHFMALLQAMQNRK